MSPREPAIAATSASTTSLCLFLIRNQSLIEKELGRVGRYDPFRDAIDGWRREHLHNQQPQAVSTDCGAAAQALSTICARFGVLDLMERKGPVRTRGSTGRLTRGPGIRFDPEELRARLEEVGRLFGSA